MSFESMKWDLQGSQTSSEQLLTLRIMKKQNMIFVHMEYAM